MKSFQERNLLAIAIVGIVVMVAVFLATFNAAALPVVGGGKIYTADFGEAGGLHEGNEVRVAGVKVGEVTGISLEGHTVKVDFRVKGAWVGDQSTAAIKIKTMLGQKYLAVDPKGREELDPDDPIPLSRTTTPYDVTAALSDLSSTVDEIDTAQLEKSFGVLSDTFRDTPESVRGMVEGLSALSRTVSSRDEELAQLLDNTKQISGTLAERNDEIALIIKDGNLLLAELKKRRDTVSAMLRGTAELGTQLRGLVTDNEKTLKPALAKLDSVSDILQRNEDSLNSAMKLVGPYYRILASTMGNGRWMDSYVCGLFDEKQAPVLESDVERDCAPGKGGGQ